MRRAIEAGVALALASCTGDAGGTETQDDSAGPPTTATVLPTGTLSDGEPKTDLAVLDLGGPDCGLNNGELGPSYIWIANSTQGTVSKIDTVTAANSDEYSGIRRVG